MFAATSASGVPMVGRCHDHGVHVGIRDELPPRASCGAHRAAALAVHPTDALVTARIDHFSHAHDLDAGVIHERIEQFARTLAIPHDAHVDAAHRSAGRRKRSWSGRRR